MKKMQLTRTGESIHKNWAMIRQYGRTYIARLPDTVLGTPRRLVGSHHSNAMASSDAVNGGV